MSDTVRHVGLYLDTGFEHSRRVASGVLDHASENPLWRLCDFRHTGHDDVQKSSRFPPWTGRVDGVIATVGRVPGILDWFERGGVPVVNAVGDLAGTRLPSVFTSVDSIARLAVAHLLELGRRSVLHVGFKGSDGSASRKRALRERLAVHGIRLGVYDTREFTSDPAVVAADAGLRERLGRLKPPSLVVTLSDEYALAVCRITASLGLRVPEDVAVLGVNDGELARLATPTLSSIRTPGRAIGHASALKLAALMDANAAGRWKPRKGEVVQVEATDLAERESTTGCGRAVFTDVDRAQRFIEQRACEGIRVVDVARHVRMPLRTFEIEYRLATGRTVGSELQRLRLERVRDLLANTDLPVSKIADLSGFATPSYVASFLRREIGATPTEYRRRARRSRGE